MFTGLIQEVGQVKSIQTTSAGRRLVISAPFLLSKSEVKIDDSIAVNGVCQTVSELSSNYSTFTVDTVNTSLEKTTLSNLRIGEEVNLELALALKDRLGGHLVLGHVNGVGKITEILLSGNGSATSSSRIVWIQVSPEIERYLVAEGSVAIDGISLTVAYLRNSKERSEMGLAIIPHSWKHTILRNKKVGDLVNIEVDILAKYLEKIIGNHSSISGNNKNNDNNQINPNRNSSGSNITEDWLRERGF